VDRQEADAGSTLNFTRRVLALRRTHPALRLGRFETLFADANVWVLRRVHDGGAVLAAFNLGDEPAVHELAQAPQPRGDAVRLNGAALDGACLHLPPGAAYILPT
jgi:alpha-glucosidase